MRAGYAPALLRSALSARRRRPGLRGGAAPAARRGDGYEFAEVRAYVAGDDPRRIDWAASARSDTLQTRVFFEDHALTLAVCIDGSASMHVGATKSAYELACETAEIWYAAAGAEDHCARIAQGFVLRSPRLRGRGAAAFCLAHREDPAGLIAGLHIALALLPRDASLLLVSDFYELAQSQALVRACARRFDLTALLVRDPWHAGLPLGGLVTLRDAESGRSAHTFIGHKQRKRYIGAVRRREVEIREKLEDYGARVGILSEESVERSLLGAFGMGGSAAPRA